jgi:hypothetical protein
VAAITTGTLNITNREFAALRTSEVSPAYELAPRIPAAPVPEDHVDITFLKAM